MAFIYIVLYSLASPDECSEVQLSVIFLPTLSGIGELINFWADVEKARLLFIFRAEVSFARFSTSLFTQKWDKVFPANLRDVVRADVFIKFK